MNFRFLATEQPWLQSS